MVKTRPSIVYHPSRLSNPYVGSDYHRYSNSVASSRTEKSLSLDRSNKWNNSPANPKATKWSTGRKVILGVIITVVVILIILAIVLAIVFTRTSNDTTTTTTTTTSATYTSVAWSFDGTTADTYGVYNGLLMNGATYSGTTSTVPYVGQGQALSLTASSSQSFQVTSPFLNLASTSFTVEAWIYTTTTTGDNGIIGQCQCSSCSNECFYFIIRSGYLYVGFTLNDIGGVTTVSTNTWYHVAFVYNSATSQQILYLNGVQDNIKSSAAAYQGGSGTITIGSTQLLSTTNYFTGYIDNLRIVTRAKSASEVLTDASLIAYYSFDLPSPTMDSGPNGLNGTSTNVATITGRVNQAMRFLGLSSFFQAYGFYQLGYGVASNKPFSIGLWINPASYISCTFLQQSQTTLTNSTCFNMIGIYSATGVTAQIVAEGYAWPAIFGPFITTNTWTHVGWTYSQTDGYRLYVNGVYYSTTGTYSRSGSGYISWLLVGYSFSCSSAYISNTAYQGSIDEIHIYNRELSSTEVSALANP